NTTAGLRRPELARRLMEKKNYQGDLVVPGKYTLRADMGLNELIDHLRAGNGEEEVQVTFNSARKLSELAGKVSVNIEADSAMIAERLADPEVAAKYGFNSDTFISMFFPDTYRMEWDTDADEFIERMAAEYKRFWTAERIQKATNYGLSQSEVSTLASIVQAEQQVHPDERKVIAGLYLNRLRKGMRLQSDPTVVYAVGDFSINRVLTKHLSTPSPYNTYIHVGLPPGPINLPSKQSVDAVLNADENRYIFMCAKADFSGYHAFATSLSEHNRNARAFQQALNDRKIYK
ncbi:MAG TPA: endolytic transglycosylase MltG, partial [Cryomorphaceae bacterium]|nr:endolytic transglycosylase MltG [Cryomorphaceae bacterium]